MALRDRLRSAGFSAIFCASSMQPADVGLLAGDARRASVFDFGPNSPKASLMRASTAVCASEDAGAVRALITAEIVVGRYFTVSVGNLPPKAKVIVKITFVMELGMDGDSLVFRLPNAVAPDTRESAGDAVTQELIPYVEREFRGIGEPYARVLDGGSTGGWVSLALQIFYPDFFNGAWASCPDGVDFRGFQLVDIYGDDSAYVNEQGTELPSARNRDGTVRFTVRHEVQMENVRHFFPKKTYGPADWRRMIYMTKVRQEQESVFGAFDCPDASQVISRRSRSTTPIQALNLFNSSFILQQSGLLEKRLLGEAGPDTASRIHFAFELCFGRAPEAGEISESEELIVKHGLRIFCRALLNSNELIFIP